MLDVFGCQGPAARTNDNDVLFDSLFPRIIFRLLIIQILFLRVIYLLLVVKVGTPVAVCRVNPSLFPHL